MTDANVKVVNRGRSVQIIIDGEIDLANAPIVENEIYAGITNQVTAASIDLSDVGYMDSAGLRILFELAAQLPVLQIELELIAPVGSPARRVMELSGLPSLARITPLSGV
jgi:stage II sporulation protein AA (anti-sigma F factor antagonist)